ncbi:MAG: hypothetical protein ACOC2D_19840 [Spirochaetota bacterium]
MKSARETEAAAFRDHRFFVALVAINLVLGRIAMRLYGDGFTYFHDAISDLGATLTRSGAPNPVSPYVFAVQLLSSAAVMAGLSRHLRARGLARGSSDVMLARLAAVGFLLMPAPHNEPVYHTIHMLGAGLVVFSLWVLAMRYLARCHRLGMVQGYRMGMAGLQGTVLPYALLFALGSPYRHVTQLLTVAALSAILIAATASLARVASSRPEALSEIRVRG